MEKGAVTWRQLKQFIETIDEKYLDNKVRWWGDERSGVIYSMINLDEDYTNISRKEWEPLSNYKQTDIENIQEYVKRGVTKILIKGTPILIVD